MFVIVRIYVVESSLVVQKETPHVIPSLSKYMYLSFHPPARKYINNLVPFFFYHPKTVLTKLQEVISPLP